MELKFDNDIIKCKKEADVHNPGSDVINSGLNEIQSFFERVQLRNGKLPVNVLIYMYEKDDVNAFAKKHDEDYIIGISTKTFLELWNWFTVWFSSPKIYEIFELDEKKKEDYIKRSYCYALMFLAAHELFHILNGHCDLPEKEEQFIFEQSKIISKERKMFEQVLEYDADCCGIACCFNQMLFDFVPVMRVLKVFGESNDMIISILKEETELLSFSFYSVFLKFSEAEHSDFDKYIAGELYVYDHPEAGIRYAYVIGVMVRIIIERFSEEAADNIIGSFTEKCMKFERIMLEKKNPKNLLYSVAFSEKGQKHTLELHNSWEIISKKLKPYAYGGLAPFEKITKQTILLNEKGEYIRCVPETPPEESV